MLTELNCLLWQYNIEWKIIIKTNRKTVTEHTFEKLTSEHFKIKEANSKNL